MRQNKKWWICAGAAFVLALSAFLLWNFLSGAATPQEEPPSAVETAKAGKKRAERRRRISAVPEAQGKAKGESVKGEPGEQGGDPGAREESRTEEGQAETVGVRLSRGAPWVVRSIPTPGWYSRLVMPRALA